LNDYQIFVECKAVELQAYPSINPTDELLYNALKDSILKAYFEQLLTVADLINPNGDNWGIIITYKELFWGDFTQLFELGKDKYPTDKIISLNPENVFIIDIYTWNAIIQIIKDNKASLLDILKIAKANNTDIMTKKQLFSMHLDRYHPMKINLDYLQEEIKTLEVPGQYV
jgi:hypothetical protein